MNLPNSKQPLTPRSFLANNYFIHNLIVPWMVSRRIKQQLKKYCQIQIKLKKELENIQATDSPLFFGPWLYRVDMELLYWIPFLNWITDKYKLDKERIFLISRGKLDLWYEKLGKYIDIGNHLTPEKMPKLLDQMPYQTSPFDNKIIRKVKKKLKIDQFYWIHPSLMTQLFCLYWQQDFSSRIVEKYTNYQPFSAPNYNLPDDLSPPYMVAKFAFNAHFPDTMENNNFVKNLLATLAQQHQLVLLDTCGDNRYQTNTMKNVHTIKLSETPDDLGLQTQIISHAQCYFGTLGEISYLPLFYGVPAIVFYATSLQQNSLAMDIEFAHRVSRALRFGKFERSTDVSTDKEKADILIFHTSHFDMLRAFL